MKVGIVFVNIGLFGIVEGVVGLVMVVEEVGIELLWMVEHVIYLDDYGLLYLYDDLGWMMMVVDIDLIDFLIWLIWVGVYILIIWLVIGILIFFECNLLVLAK